MRTQHQIRIRLVRFTLTIGVMITCSLSGNRVHAAPADPVEELRQALNTPFLFIDLDNPIVLKERDKVLEKAVSGLRTMSQLARGAALSEWKDDRDALTKHFLFNQTSQKLEMSKIDYKHRQDVGKRFVDLVRKTVAKADEDSSSEQEQTVLAKLLGDMGPSVRSLDYQDDRGFVRTLTPELVQLAAPTRKPSVRQAALWALGRIDPIAKEVAPLLEATLLTKLPPDAPLELRQALVRDKRVAAEALGEMIQTLVKNFRAVRLDSRQDLNRGNTGQEVIETCVILVPVASRGLRAELDHEKDRDRQVCRLCADALYQASTALSVLVPQPVRREDVLPRHRTRTAAEDMKYKAKVAELERERKAVEPLVVTLANEGTIFAASAAVEQEPELRLLACRSLENLAGSRFRLLRRVADFPEATGEKVGEDKLAEKLLQGIQPSLEVINARVQDRKDKDVRVRRAALAFLDALEHDAAPAQAGLIVATKDADLFVRWAAAQALGKIEPEQAAEAVPALAELLQDDDLDVRIAAAVALDAYGPVATPAMPALVKAVTKGDVSFRIVGLKAIGSINGEAAASSIDVIVKMLMDRDARLRAAAAYTLGTFGPMASRAVPELRRCLDDEDVNVRRTVTDALNSILTEQKR